MDMNLSNNPSFGIVTIDEPITSSREIVAQLNEFNNNDNIDAIIVRLNTPGGVWAMATSLLCDLNGDGRYADESGEHGITLDNVRLLGINSST